MIDLNEFHRRKDIIKQRCGVRKTNNKEWGPWDEKNHTEVFSLYFNPLYGDITGIRNNETNIFYELRKQEDIINFVNKLNYRENEFSTFLTNMELHFKKTMDRENRFYDRIYSLENENLKLKTDLEKIMEETSYWKHKVGSLLFILSKFEDQEKVRELIKEIEEEGYQISDKND